MNEEDIAVVVKVFTEVNWLKPASLFQSYLTEQDLQEKLIWVAFYDNQFAGCVTLK